MNYSDLSSVMTVVMMTVFIGIVLCRSKKICRRNKSGARQVIEGES